MTMARRICVVTGTRAEYGLLTEILRAIGADPAFDLQLVVTGMHLSPEFGLTVKAIEADGFTIADRVDMLVTGDSGVATAKSMGLGISGFADSFARLKPDVLLVLGDRFEILAAAQAALVMQLPIAHIAGGDSTEGAFDEAIRHSITKMSALHFVTNPEAAARVRQLGENPAHIHIVGSPGLDTLRQMTLLDRPALEAALGTTLRPKNLLVTYHPETLAIGGNRQPFQELLSALAALDTDTGLFFTYPNADPGGRELIAMIDAFTALHPNVHACHSLGQLRYLSLMRHADVVVGNSSSGLYEAPSFKIPTVNVGDRQRGRLKAASVIDCGADRHAIGQALTRAFSTDFADICRDAVNPYGDGHATKRILDVLRQTPDFRVLIRKQFFDLESAA
jgi:UDP-hydrolysing UDP-N-acetyl-D-glucosamine 2-epimerase